MLIRFRVILLDVEFCLSYNPVVEIQYIKYKWDLITICVLDTLALTGISHGRIKKIQQEKPSDPVDDVS